MRTRPPSLTFLQARLPEPEVITGGRVFRLGAVFLAGGGGKFSAVDTGGGSGAWRFIQEGKTGFIGAMLRLGSATGLSMTIVPSDVREQAPSGSSMLPATTIMPILHVPGIRESSDCSMFRGTRIVEILGRKGVLPQSL
jgi:hypothetical protein